jgi:hypothetical protein
MLEKNYKLAEMIFLEQVMGERGPDGGRAPGRKKQRKTASLSLGRTFKLREFIPCLS